MKRLLLSLLVCIMLFSGCINREETSEFNNKTLEEKGSILSDDTETISKTYKDDKLSDSIVLYNGYLLKKEFKRQNSYDYDEEYDERTLNRDYRNYGNGRYTGNTVGKVGKGDIFGESRVFNVGEFAITANYNAIPRNIQKLDKLPDNLSNKLKIEANQKVSSLMVDLDGNGMSETIICTLDWSEHHIKSDVILYDESGEKVERIIYIDEEGMFNEIDLLDGVEIIDIDNDGIMEIIADIPCYELHSGYKVTVLKYDGEKLIGEYDVGYIGA